MELSSSIVVLLVIVLIARELRSGRDVVRSDTELQARLGSSERFRTLRMQILEAILALVIVGSLLVGDIAQTPMHVVLIVVGGVVGYVFGVYRARTTFVSSVPAHRGVILRYSIESLLALGLLIVVKLVAEQDLLPDGEIFRSIVAVLLGFLLVESCARVITLVRYYRRDERALTSTEPSTL